MVAAGDHMGMYGCGLYIDTVPQGLSHWTDRWPLFSTYTPFIYTEARSVLTVKLCVVSLWYC